MICFPNAKINIGLHVTGKRDDGYHNIETIFFPVGLHDVLEIIENNETGAPQFSFESTGIAIPGNIESNLCIKACELIKRDYYLPPLKIHLHKNIPMGAGLGGGSSDAAHCIKLLDEAFELNLAYGEKHHYARQLGSDCCVFINNRPAFGAERGDQLEFIDLDLKDLFLVIIYPGIHVSTAEAYSMIQPTKPSFSLENLQQLPLEKWRDQVKNDFEKPVFNKYPKLGEVKTKLYDLGATYSAMSGSGSAIYALFKHEINAGDHFKDCWTWQEKMK
jgi:4-diphosphocytidyl-2-C-methyl-D-erythritol kinase